MTSTRVYPISGRGHMSTSGQLFHRADNLNFTLQSKGNFDTEVYADSATWNTR